MLAQVSNSGGSTAAATTGPIVTVASATIALSETIARITLPTTPVAGAKEKGRLLLKIKNDGNVPSTGKVKIVLSFVPVGSNALPTQIVSLTPRPVILVGGSTVVTVPIATIPLNLSGSYTLIAQATDPAGGTSSVSGGSTYTIS